MSYLLITPKAPRQLVFMKVDGIHKRPVILNSIQPAVEIGGLLFDGWPFAPPSLMINTRRDGLALFRNLSDLLLEPYFESRPKATVVGPLTPSLVPPKPFTRGSLRAPWLEKAHAGGLVGEVRIPLITTDGRVFVHTYNTDYHVDSFEITEPTLYQSGNVLTEAQIVEQLEEAQRTRLRKVADALNYENTAGLDLRLL